MCRGAMRRERVHMRAHSQGECGIQRHRNYRKVSRIHRAQNFLAPEARYLKLLIPAEGLEATQRWSMGVLNRRV